MPDTDWVDNVKAIVIKAVEAGDPCDIETGIVTGMSPLAVQLDQKITLSGPQLLLSRSVTDHAEEMNIPGVGTVSVTVKAGLKTGEAVVLLQKSGGQQYLIIDRQ